jgi:hypothetical protein
MKQRAPLKAPEKKPLNRSRKPLLLAMSFWVRKRMIAASEAV